MKLVVFCASSAEASVVAGLFGLDVPTTPVEAVASLRAGRGVAVQSGFAHGWTTPDDDVALLCTAEFRARNSQATVQQAVSRVHRIR